MFCPPDLAHPCSGEKELLRNVAIDTPPELETGTVSKFASGGIDAHIFVRR
jgi:hypothetical protein